MSDSSPNQRAARLSLLWALATAFALSLLPLVALPETALGNEGEDLVEGRDFEVNEAVVKLLAVDPDSGDSVTAEEFAEDYDATVEEVLAGVPRVYLLRFNGDSDELAEAQELAADPRVDYAEVNFVAEPPLGKARFRAREESRRAQNATNRSAVSSMGLACARGSGATGLGSTVAVLDTGIQARHPALRDNLAGVPSYDFVENSDDLPSLEGPMAGHGTHVAGIVDLVAPESGIMDLRVLDGRGHGNAVAIAKAVAFARTNGADVVNLSLSTPDESLLVDDYLDWARASGLVVTAAAGNDGDASEQYPAANTVGTDGLISVTAVNGRHTKSSYASYGLWVDVAAPGNAIRSTYPVGKYANLSGTSMSTPFVAGEAAVLLGEAPAQSPAEIEALIRAGADPLDALNPDYAGLLGAGEADLGNSLSQLQPGLACG